MSGGEGAGEAIVVDGFVFGRCAGGGAGVAGGGYYIGRVDAGVGPDEELFQDDCVLVLVYGGGGFGVGHEVGAEGQDLGVDEVEGQEERGESEEHGIGDQEGGVVGLEVGEHE